MSEVAVVVDDGDEVLAVEGVELSIEVDAAAAPVGVEVEPGDGESEVEVEVDAYQPVDVEVVTATATVEVDPVAEADVEVAEHDSIPDVDHVVEIIAGPRGPAGLGIPAGGEPMQVLVKQGAEDYDLTWADPADGSLTLA